MIVTIGQAKAGFSRLIAAALAGEEVVITRGSEPAVRLTPMKPPGVKMRSSNQPRSEKEGGG
jgi:prevent-host-death family protein